MGIHYLQEHLPCICMNRFKGMSGNIKMALGSCMKQRQMLTLEMFV